MVIDGERLKELLRTAQEEVILCAPFIKAEVVRLLLANIRDGVSIQVYTRWRPAEVAAGISDLEVFDVVGEREKAQLFLLDALHAKIYVSDRKCLLGSANLTASALGWSTRNNLELLVPARRDDPDVKDFLDRLGEADVATFAKKAEIAEEVERIGMQPLDEGRPTDAGGATWHSQQWLPRCAAPEKLYRVYSDNNTNDVTTGTREDCMRDLSDLSLPKGLSQEGFESVVRERLLAMPAMQQILAKVPARLSDTNAQQLVSMFRPDLEEQDVKYLWQIVREWIGVFFRKEYEVAPESFVVRLRGSRHEN